MKRVVKYVVLTLMLAAMPSAAFAQPVTESAAVSGEVGLFLPRDNGLSSGPAIEGFYEYYLSARDSIRFGVGWARPKFKGDENRSVRYLRIPFDFVRNWEGGTVHPFVGAGVALYLLQHRSHGQNVGDSDTKLGGTFFGGVEIFTAAMTTVKVEGRYHAVQNSFFNPDGFTFSVGLKQYF